MNIFQEIKAFFVAKQALSEIIKGANTMNGTKPGFKTSEFWMDIATKVGLVWASVSGFVPPKWGAVITAAGTAIYVVARTVAKAVADIQMARMAAPAATVSATAIASDTAAK